LKTNEDAQEVGKKEEEEEAKDKKEGGSERERELRKRICFYLLT